MVAGALALAATGCSPVYSSGAAPPAFYSLAYGLGDHEVAIGGVGVGTVMAVVDNRAFAFTVHHSLGELDIVVDRHRAGRDNAQTFEVLFDRSQASGCTASFSLPAFGPAVSSGSVLLWSNGPTAAAAGGQ